MIFYFENSFSQKEKELFKKAQEEDLVKICLYLKTDKKLFEKVQYKVFSTQEAKQSADPNHSISRASARFDEMTIYRFWLPTEDPHFPHELTHLVAHKWTKPYFYQTELDTLDNKKIQKTISMVSTSFTQEGLAIAVDDIIFKRKLLENNKLMSVDDWCREQLDKIPNSLEEVINFDGFNLFKNKIVVPFSASLSKFILQTFGIGRYKEMYIKLKETNSPKENVKNIERICGLNESKIINQWKETLIEL